MFSDDDIRQAARELFVQGEKPSVRKVRAHLGGGTQSRIAAVLRSLHLPHPEDSVAEEFPPYLLNAIRRYMQESRALGKAEVRQVTADLQARIDYLEAQVAALTDALTERSKIRRMTNSAVLKAVQGKDSMPDIVIDGERITSIRNKKMEDLTANQREVLRKYRDDLNRHKQEARKNPEIPIKRRNRGIMIDGLKGYQIADARIDTLTPAQREWRREYESKKRERRKQRTKE